MKKLFTILMLLLTTTTFAQQSQDTLRLKHFSTWAIAPYLATPFQYTDVENISLSTKITGVGINLEKHLSHYTSFQLGLFNTPMYIENNNKKYSINLTQYDAKFYLHVTNGNILRTWRSTQLYLYGGLGRLNYNTKIVSTEVDTFRKEVSGKALVLSLGGGLKYKVGNRTSLFLDGGGNFTSSDKIDGVIVPYSNNDGYFKMSLGLSYTFGKKRMIEWDNPYQYLVPEEVHDTTVVLKTIKCEHVSPKPEITYPDSVVVYYLPGSYQMEVPYLSKLDSLIDNVIQNQLTYSLEVSAYCDTVGSDKKNKDLVMKRAEEVCKYIRMKVVEDTGNDISNRLMIKLNDESAAIYSPDARNRKVIVKILK
jgi:hypothetical protein